VFHIDLLTPYKEMEEYGQAYMRPPPITVQSEEEYEVESILQARRKGVGNSLEYKVHWKGYPSADDSWVLHEDLHLPDLLKEFYAQGGKVLAVKRKQEWLQKLISSLSCLLPVTTQATSPLRTFPLLPITTKDPPWSICQTRSPSNGYNGWQFTLPISYEPSQCSTLVIRQTAAMKNKKDGDNSYMSPYKSFTTTTKWETPPQTFSIHPLGQFTAISSLQDKMIKLHRPLGEPSSMASCKSSETIPICTPSTTQRVSPQTARPLPTSTNYS
jgi:chromodomain-containing protein